MGQRARDGREGEFKGLPHDRRTFEQDHPRGFSPGLPLHPQELDGMVHSNDLPKIKPNFTNCR